MNILGDIWNGIVAGLNFLLQAIYGLTGNYGVAIILLTVLVKLILLPLTIKQTRSMIAMQKIQPEIKKLQEKFKDDREKLSQEMMKFYRENKVNPLGGCLPLILQMPVFIALFTVLRKYLLTPPTIILGNTFAALKDMPGLTGLAQAYAGIPEVKDAGFLWVKSLADSTGNADPTFILTVLLAATTWFSQKQVMTDPRQKNLLIIMPLITAFIGWTLPAGVVLYWLTTNVLQIAQQYALGYYDKKHPRELPKPKEAAKKEAAKAVPEKASRKAPAPQGKGDHAGRPKAAKTGQKPQGAPPKGKDEAKQGAASPKSGKAPVQTRRPKGPPPKQKQPAKKPGGKGGARKK